MSSPRLRVDRGANLRGEGVRGGGQEARRKLQRAVRKQGEVDEVVHQRLGEGGVGHHPVGGGERVHRRQAEVELESLEQVLLDVDELAAAKVGE
eukprot:338398-Prorocentrum_minimum.AAC.1